MVRRGKTLLANITIVDQRGRAFEDVRVAVRWSLRNGVHRQAARTDNRGVSQFSYVMPEGVTGMVQVAIIEIREPGSQEGSMPEQNTTRRIRISGR